MNLDKRLLSEAGAARLHLGLTIGAGFLGGVLLVIQARVLSRVIDGVFLSGQTLPDVRPALLALVGIAIVRAALLWVRHAASGQVAVRVKGALRERLFAHLMALGPATMQAERSGELSGTLVDGIEALDAYFRQYLPQLALAALVPLTILVFVFPLDVISGVVLLVTAPLIPLFMVLIGQASELLTRRQWTSLSRMSAHFLDVMQGLTTLKIFGRSREQAQTIAAISDRFRRTTLDVLRVTFLSALVLEMVGTISTAIVAVQIGLRLLYARMVFVDVLFILLVAPEFYLPLRTLGARFHAGMSGGAAARRIFEVLEMPRTPSHLALLDVSPPCKGEMVEDQRGFEFSKKLEAIHFEDVHYAYQGGERPALNGVTFTLAAGQVTALVGASGAGKSTVAHLLLRFIEPIEGVIRVNGEPLADLHPDAWRRWVAWVPQRPHLFFDTAAANILLAKPDASMDEVRQAAEMAYAHRFIEALPDGYDTVIGERGARLSGGQAQRIALARAFLKDAPLVILDEATANLDPDHEALVRESVRQLLAERTALVIAHRLNTVTAADRIVVLDGGRVAQVGSHAELVQQPGIYHNLITAYGGKP